MATPAQYRPVRVLVFLLAMVVGLAVWAFWPGQGNTPRLGLDLRGGTQVILAPEPIEEDAVITDEQLQQTVEIIRQRVNGIGVAEADVNIQGSGNDSVIVVSIPGVTQDRVVDLVGQTALLNFRPVENILGPEALDEEGNPITDDPADSTGEDEADEVVGEDQDQADDVVGGTQIVQSPEFDEEFGLGLLALDCTDPANWSGGSPDDPEQWLATCDQEGLGKYVLQPAFIRGINIDSASAQQPSQGLGGWVVTLDFDTEGARQLAEASTQLSAQQPPQNQFAIVLDGVVVSAPAFSEPILGGSAQIEGNFTRQEAEDLAQVLKFGALPLTLNVESVESVSPTLGDDQLQAGLLAGLLGLILVSLYLFFYYRILGVVATLSLLVVGLLTYSSFVVLGRTIGFTLTLAGVAGAIVAIGITADSFVVYFERIRDEIREGRSLRQAADAGWVRARRTLLAADAVSMMAAVILYWLSVGNVRGFAFALGLTTVFDVVVAFMFTRPLVALMSRSRWMQRGSWLTGVSPKRLGVASLDGVRREKGAKRTPRKPVTAGAPSGSDKRRAEREQGEV